METIIIVPIVMRYVFRGFVKKSPSVGVTLGEGRELFFWVFEENGAF